MQISTPSWEKFYLIPASGSVIQDGSQAWLVSTSGYNSDTSVCAIANGAFVCKWPTYQPRDLLTVKLVQGAKSVVQGGDLISFTTATGQCVTGGGNAIMSIQSASAPLSPSNVFQVRLTARAPALVHATHSGTG